MRIAPEITLALLPERDGPRSAVLVSNHSTGTEVSGCVLEAAIQCGPGWLLFVTDDVPGEDMLSIYLLNPAGKLIDWARIGGPYSTGSFADLRMEPPSTVRFRFIDEADWAVVILDRARFGIPWLPDAKGVSRGAGVLRYLTVRRSESHGA